MKIAVIGTGYVGLVSGACFANWGHQVACIDKNAQKIAALQNGIVPIYEPGLDELVERNFGAGRLSFTCDLLEAVKGAAMVLIAVGTPPRAAHGDADLSFVFSAARELAPLIDDDTVVVVKSTVPVGTGDIVQKIIGSVREAGTFSVASNPEFLREGVAISDFLEPDRVVVGVEDDRARARLTELYGVPLKARKTPIIVTQRRTSELIKYAANAFLATKITFINELADLCEQVGSDVSQLAVGIGLDKRIGTSFLNAGPGYGGSCFPKDVKALIRTAHENDFPPLIMAAVEARNDAQKEVLFQKIQRHFNGAVAGKTIAVWGLSFKPKTDDMREASSTVLMEALWRAGATVQAYDPKAMQEAQRLYGVRDDLTLCGTREAALKHADALVIVTEWQEFKAPDLDLIGDALSEKVIFDGRNLFSPERMARAGFAYYGIGRGL